MLRILITIAVPFLLFIGASAHSQEEVEDSFIPNYTAGRLGATWQDEADIQSGGSLEIIEASVQGDAPIINRETLKLTAGIRYRWNEFSFSNAADPFGSTSLDLHRLEVPANLWVERNDWRFWFRLQPGIMSDFSDLSSDSFAFTGLALASYRFSDRVSIAAGGYYSRDLGSDKLLPAFGLIWRPNPNWSVSLTAPRLQVSFAPSETWLLTLNAFPSGGGWNIEVPGYEEHADLEYSAIRASFGIDYRLADGPCWLYLGIGIPILSGIETGR